MSEIIRKISRISDTVTSLVIIGYSVELTCGTHVLDLEMGIGAGIHANNAGYSLLLLILFHTLFGTMSYELYRYT